MTERDQNLIGIGFEVLRIKDKEINENTINIIKEALIEK